ncbi:hypothetical protein PHISP_05413 [Aspergillus sp. HF37]|nr:hypothetical protein PHISP_05413 [Aspergillus sp. HF37]
MARPSLQEYAKAVKGELKTHPETGPSHKINETVSEGKNEEVIGTEPSRQENKTVPEEKHREVVETEPSRQGDWGILQKKEKPMPKAEDIAQKPEGTKEESLDQGQQTRSQAVTLIRARTVSRASAPPTSSPTEVSSAQLTRQPVQQGPVSDITEPVKHSKKKSKKKSKSKKGTESHPAESSDPRDNEPHQPGNQSEHASLETSNTEPHSEQITSVIGHPSSQNSLEKPPVSDQTSLELDPNSHKSKQSSSETHQPAPRHHEDRVQSENHSSAKDSKASSDSSARKKDGSKIHLKHRSSRVHSRSLSDPGAVGRDTSKSRAEQSSPVHSSASGAGTNKTSNENSEHYLSAAYSRSPSDTFLDTKDTSKTSVEHHSVLPSATVDDAEDTSKGDVEHSSSATHDESSTSSDVEKKAIPGAHLETRLSTESGQTTTESRVGTEDRRNAPFGNGDGAQGVPSREATSAKAEAEESPGKYDHLLGDPNLGLSDRKNKGRIESVIPQETPKPDVEQTASTGSPPTSHQTTSATKEEKPLPSTSKSISSETPAPSPKVSAPPPSKTLNPSSKEFTPSPKSPEPVKNTDLGRPLSGRSRGSPSAIRRAEASDPETPVQTHPQPRRYGATPERLPPIQEVSPPAAAGVVAAPTPGSSTATASTTQTGRTGRLGSQATPDSTLTAEPVDTASGPIHGFSGAVARPACSNSHAHPGDDTSTSSPGAAAPAVVCATAGCNTRCNLWDGTAAICPRCGPHTEVRYCTQTHLLEDVKWHWVWCGRVAVTHPCPADSNIPEQVRERVPLMPCLHNWDTPERHRQAVSFNTNGLVGDYFVFADWADLREAGFPADPLAQRCPSRVVETIRFDDPGEKDRFRRVLAVCLFSSIENTGLVDYMFRLIRDALRSRAAWTAETDAALRLQIMRELQVAVRPEITGSRHACDVDWDGRNPRHCRDPVCRSQRRYFLGDLGRGRGYRRLVDNMEASHWILRAARTTHPQVASVAARARGEGFPDVVEDERRLFRRGPGWDGPGSGDMEIEGINA